MPQKKKELPNLAFSRSAKSQREYVKLIALAISQCACSPKEFQGNVELTLRLFLLFYRVIYIKLNSTKGIEFS